MDLGSVCLVYMKVKKRKFLPCKPEFSNLMTNGGMKVRKKKCLAQYL